MSDIDKTVRALVSNLDSPPYPATNRMTPVVLTTVLIGEGVAAELSTSDPQPDLGDRRPVLFGVSVAIAQADGTTTRVLGGVGVTAPIRSGVFGSRAAAEAHVKEMTAYLRLAFEREGARAGVTT